MLEKVGVLDRLKRVMDVEAAEELADIIGAVLDETRRSVTKADFDELKEIVRDLAQAQKRTEEALQALTRQVGGLSETIGGDIEDIAYIVLHDVLKREFGWKVGVLQRTWQTWDKQPEEVNIFGQAFDPARPDVTIWIVGEAKHNLSVKEVIRFTKQLERGRRYLGGEIFPVCFCYRARPEVQEMVKANRINLVFSYGHLERAEV